MEPCSQSKVTQNLVLLAVSVSAGCVRGSTGIIVSVLESETEMLQGWFLLRPLSRGRGHRLPPRSPHGPPACVS